jgi:hypothetical protein
VANYDLKDFTTGLARTFKSVVVGGVNIPGKVLYDEAGAEVLGEVTASPTANTVLDRLKSIYTAITTATLTVGTHAVTQSGTWTVATNADGTTAAGTAASKALAVGGIYNSTEPSPTTGQGLALQLDSKGRARSVLMDAAGNTRGANVNSSNQLTVSVDNTPAVTQSGTWNVGHGKTIKSVSGTMTSSTDVIAAVSTKRIKVLAYSIVTLGTTAATYIFKSNNSTEVWRIALQAPASSNMFGANLSIPAPSFLFATTAGEKLTLVPSGSDTIHYAITYFDDDTT